MLQNGQKTIYQITWAFIFNRSNYEIKFAE